MTDFPLRPIKFSPHSPPGYCCCVQHVSTITSTARVSRQIYRIAKDLLVRRKWQGNLRSGIPSARLYFTAEFYLTILWVSTPSLAMRNPFSKSAATRQRIDLYQMRSPMNASAKLWPNLPSWPIARVHQVSIFYPNSEVIEQPHTMWQASPGPADLLWCHRTAHDLLYRG